MPAGGDGAERGAARLHDVRAAGEPLVHRPTVHRAGQAAHLVLPDPTDAPTAVRPHPHRLPRRHRRFHPPQGEPDVVATMAVILEFQQQQQQKTRHVGFFFSLSFCPSLSR